MRTPITSDFLVERCGMGSVPSPEMDTVQHRVEDVVEKSLRTDLMSDHASHERNKPIPLSTPIPWRDVVGSHGDGERYLVQVVDLADIGSPGNLPAIPGSRFDSARDENGVLSSRQEALPELLDSSIDSLLDFSIDIEGLLAKRDSVEQDRPKGKLLKFELPARMKGVPPARLVDSSNSTGTAPKVIEFRRPEFLDRKYPAGGTR